MPEMLERVTQALDALLDDWVAGRIHTPDLSRAAIQAMRAPPEAVLGAIHDKVRIECRPAERAAYIVNADEMWAAGIDAMLGQAGGQDSLRTAPRPTPKAQA